MNVPLAIKAGIIDLEDADDSLSAPNAILGSQNSSSTSHPVIPWIYVTSNCTSQSQSSDYPTDFPYNFQPISMRVKPIRMIEERSLVIIGINGWELDGKEVVNVYGAGIVWGGPGHVRSFRLGMGHWGRKEGEKGRGVNVLEIKCYVYEGKREERRFVVDDLVVSVLDTEEEEGDRDARSEL